MLTDISNLPDHSRLWIFPADRRLEKEEALALMNEVQTYLRNWKAHGAPVSAAAQMERDQFLIVAANPDVAAPSGCSIDDLTRNLQRIGRAFKVDLINSAGVYFELNREVRWVTRPEFKALASDGTVTGATAVFDNSLTKLSEYREGKWHLPASESWQKVLL